jgi:hypothetical protein
MGLQWIIKQEYTIQPLLFREVFEYYIASYYIEVKVKYRSEQMAEQVNFEKSWSIMCVFLST